MTPDQLAATLRAHYGSLGNTVYDRRDRWRDEHTRCRPRDHVVKMEGSVHVELCEQRGMVLVAWESGLKASGCTRCGNVVHDAAVPEFIRQDYLCTRCVETGLQDWEVAQRVVESERQSRVPTE